MLLQNKLVSCQMALRNIYNRLPNLLWDLLPNFLQKICGAPPYKTDNNQEVCQPSFDRVPFMWKFHIKNFIMGGCLFGGLMNEGDENSPYTEDRVLCSGGTKVHMFGDRDEVYLSVRSEVEGCPIRQEDYLELVRIQMKKYLRSLSNKTHSPFLYGMLLDTVCDGHVFVVLDDIVQAVTLHVGMVPYEKGSYFAAFMRIRPIWKKKLCALKNEFREVHLENQDRLLYIIPGKDAKKDPRQIAKEPYMGNWDEINKFMDIGGVGQRNFRRKIGIDEDFPVLTRLVFKYYVLKSCCPEEWRATLFPF